MRTESLIMVRGIETMGRYYSFYRGMVLDNEDPKHMNQLQIMVPQVQGGIIIWALPFDQHGGTQTGFKYLAPEIGDTVYVMFECGDPSKPLWAYHGFALDQMPEELDGPNKMGIITPRGNILILDDSTGDLNISTLGNITVKAKGTIQFNEGKNEGVININQLTEKLNKTVKELENLRNLFNSHTHSGVKAGSSISATPVVQATSPFSQYNKQDYEDTKVIH